MGSLSPAMQRLLDEITELYTTTGQPVVVGRKNRTVQALIKRDELVLVTDDGESIYVRPHADEPSLFKRIAGKIKGNKHRPKFKNRKAR